jgi:hypothetical protein
LSVQLPKDWQALDILQRPHLAFTMSVGVEADSQTLFYIHIFFFSFETGSHYLTPGWPSTHTPLASASQVIFTDFEHLLNILHV